MSYVEELQSLIDSPSCGKRKRTPEQCEALHEASCRSPNKQRLLNENYSIKLYAEPSEPEEEKENSEATVNSPARKRVARIKDLSQKLKKRSSLSGLLSPKKPSAPKKPNDMFSPPKPALDALQQERLNLQKTSSVNSVDRKRTNMSNSMNFLKSPMRKSKPTPARNNYLDLLRSPTRPVPVVSESSSPKSPGLSRSISMYSLTLPSPSSSDAPDEPVALHSSRLPALASPRINLKLVQQLEAQQDKSPAKRKKKRVVSLSLRNTRKRSVTDFKQLFGFGTHSEAAESGDEHDSDTKPINYRYFTTDLTLLMHYQQTLLGLEDLSVPYIVSHCSSVIRTHFLKEEGLFRISPSWTKLEEVIREIEQCDYAGKRFLESPKSDAMVDENGLFKPHIYSGLLKKFLRDLPEPLLGAENYDRWISAMDMFESDYEGSVEKLKVLIKDLPANQYHLLEHIVDLARDIDRERDVNKMNANNLSRVIGPNILWNNEITNPTISGNHIAVINNIALELIQNAPTYFYNITNTETNATNSESLSQCDANDEESVADDTTVGEEQTLAPLSEGLESEEDAEQVVEA